MPDDSGATDQTSDGLTPILTIVTPTYNSIRFITETGESVRRIGLPLEWIVVDNCSTDGTVDGVRALGFPKERLKIFVNPANTGTPTAGWIRGVKAGCGKYVVMLGSDDVVPSGDAYREAIAFMERHPEVGCALGRTGYMTDEGHVYKVKSIPFVRYGRVVSGRRLFWTIFLSPTYPLKEGCAVYRRDLVERCGHAYDIDLMLDLARITSFYLVDKTALHYRNVESSLSSGNRHDRFWLRIARKHFGGGRFDVALRLIGSYRLTIGFFKRLYRRFSPNRL